MLAIPGFTPHSFYPLFELQARNLLADLRAKQNQRSDGNYGFMVTRRLVRDGHH